MVPAEQRRLMVARQLAARGIANLHVLTAMGEVPREAFVPESLREFAYDDGPLPIGADQTISQPYIVARMIEAAEVGLGDRVLEVGAGSGYAAAVLSRIAAEVVTIERHASLGEAARLRLRALGYDNVAMGASAWRTVRRSMPSWWLPAARKCPSRSSDSSPWAASWSCRSAARRDSACCA
jgi:protein-L-isoaspartate(D-aspartate) O-methyltransferase